MAHGTPAMQAKESDLILGYFHLPVTEWDGRDRWLESLPLTHQRGCCKSDMVDPTTSATILQAYKPDLII